MTPLKGRNIIMYLAGLVVVLVVGISVFVLMSEKKRSLADEAKKKEAAVKAGPTVKLAMAVNSAAGRTFNVIGEVRPFQSVTLYAKVSGYLKKIYVDKGDKVSEGQTIAVIESPELDEDYRSSQVDAANKKLVADRDKELLAKNYIAKEQAEASETQWKLAQAKVNSMALQVGYETIKAPFAGIVTARYADNGALLQNAANSSGGALPVAQVSQLTHLRVYIYVDQRDAGYVKNGYPVTISMQEKPGFKLSAKITRITGQLDPKTRMMLAEIELDNNKGEIVPGSYVQVSITAPSGNGFPMLPVEALVVRKDKYFVPLLNADSTVHFQEIKIKENTGEKLLVAEGIKEGDVVVLNLGESVSEGGKVRVVKPQ